MALNLFKIMCPGFKKPGFDSDKYIKEQADNIQRRIDEFGGKLYLEFGGKIFDDYHASRVLPGFKPDTKISMLKSMQDKVEILVAVNANHIEKNKVRGDLGISYEDECFRLIEIFRELGFLVGGVVVTHYDAQPNVESFIERMKANEIETYKHFRIEGYPFDVDHVVSEEGLGKNDYVKTTKPLVVVTAPGPGSGKMATCISQLYRDNKRGIRSGYAKYETFPIWNLPLSHPVNIAYEAATVDLNDINAIDPFHLENYGKTTVNYNRDIENFPILKRLMEEIMGESPYKSPTDMGVNMAGNAIKDDNICKEAAKSEILRRYFETAVKVAKTNMHNDELERQERLCNRAGVHPSDNPAYLAAVDKAEKTGKPAGALVLPDGTLVSGKTSELLGCASSLLMNSLKTLSKVEDVDVITDEAIKPICSLKTDTLGSSNLRLHSDETLIALAISSSTNDFAKKILQHAKDLRGSDAFFTVIISETDYKLYKSLGINVSCMPIYERRSLFHNN